jgi:hypothetical protein
MKSRGPHRFLNSMIVSWWWCDQSVAIAHRDGPRFTSPAKQAGAVVSTVAVGLQSRLSGYERPAPGGATAAAVPAECVFQECISFVGLIKSDLGSSIQEVV